MSRKLLALLSVLMLMVVPLASVNAQETAEGINYCEILPEADCQILVQSTSAMADVSSLSFDMSLVYDIAMDEAGMGDMSFAIDGNGAVAFDSVLFTEMNELAMSDPEAYMQQMPTLLDGIFAGIDGEMSLSITLPEMLAAMGEMPSEIPLNLVFADGVYAVDFATLAAALGEDANGMSWIGLDLNGAFESMMGEMDFSDMMGEDMIPMMGGTDITEAVTITRLPDSTLNGQSVAVFELIFDYGAMLDKMGFREMLTGMYSDMGIPQSEIDGIIGMLEDVTIDMRQYVGLDDFYTYRWEFVMNMQMDGETMGDPSMGTMAFNMTMSFDMNDFNAPVDVTVPADAQVFPFEMLMGSGL